MSSPFWCEAWPRPPYSRPNCPPCVRDRSMIPTRWALSCSVRNSWMTVQHGADQPVGAVAAPLAVRDLVLDRVPGEEVLAELGEQHAAHEPALARASWPSACDLRHVTAAKSGGTLGVDRIGERRGRGDRRTGVDVRRGRRRGRGLGLLRERHRGARRATSADDRAATYRMPFQVYRCAGWTPPSSTGRTGTPWRAVHGQDAYYDAEALVSGRDSLNEHESAAVGDVAGLDVLHLQCHIGFDSISLARRGARVTGADFSPASLAGAAELAERCGRELELGRGRRDGPPAVAARPLRPRLLDDRRARAGSTTSTPGCAACARRCGPAGGSRSSRSTRCS